MKKIAIEEHFRTEYYINYLLAQKKSPRMDSYEDENKQKIYREWFSADDYTLWVPRAISRLCDIGEGRLKDMDEDGIDMQVLSFPPGIDSLSISDGIAMARKINEELSLAVKKYPDRFAGFAALALKDSRAAADELERGVKQLGLKGAIVFPHVAGEYLDSKKFWPVLEMAARLGVPLYMHPTFPPPANQHLYSDYPQLGGSMWGFAAETGLAAVRLICSGVFDEYPNLKIILGHLGEALPFWIQRLDTRMLTIVGTLMKVGAPPFIPLTKILKKLPSHYIRNNFFITNSGMLFEPSLLCCLLTLGADRILFAVDYPMEPNQEAIQFLETVKISNTDREKIFHLNAEKLLGL